MIYCVVLQSKTLDLSTLKLSTTIINNEKRKLKTDEKWEMFLNCC